jgi:hypothetical protein
MAARARAAAAAPGLLIDTYPVSAPLPRRWPTAGQARSCSSSVPAARARLPHQVWEEATKQLGGFLDSWRSKYPDVNVSQDVVQGHPARPDRTVRRRP